MTDYLYCETSKAVLAKGHLQTTDCVGPHHPVAFNAEADEIENEAEAAVRSIVSKAVECMNSIGAMYEEALTQKLTELSKRQG